MAAGGTCGHAGPDESASRGVRHCDGVTGGMYLDDIISLYDKLYRFRSQ